MRKNESGDATVRPFEHGYLSKAQVCEMLGVTQRTLEGWMHRGHVPYFKIGRWVRFREDDIHQHLQKYRIQRGKGFLPTRRSAKLEIAAEQHLK
jgi:excisionase family DNA binding protein